MAVSKLKPANDILALARPPASSSPETRPHLHFGENYAQELTQKASLLPRSIHWHFIGGLQSTHCKSLARIPNLFAVSSIDTPKKAQLLNKARGEFLASNPAPAATTTTTSPANQDDPSPPSDGTIGVHVQVNTSGEESKSGCAPGEETISLCRLVASPECPHLRLLGLMTIGAIARSVATTPETENDDFRCLSEQRDLVAAALAREGLLEGGAEALELSMGMSEDFEGAIAMGSSEVRVGSTIFGVRGPKAEAKVVV